MALPRGPVPQTIGAVLCRLVVPLWILAGASFKLAEHTPKLLPQTIFDTFVKEWGLPGYGLLATIIALEFFAVGVMFFIPRLARAMAIFMLSCFTAILLWEMAEGNFANCGCFGKLPVPPWVTFAIDAVLLLGVILLHPRERIRMAWHPRWSMVAGVLFVLVGAGLSYGVVIPAGRAPEEQPRAAQNTGGEDGSDAEPEDGTTAKRPAAPPPGTTDNPDPRPLPGLWYVKDIDAWIGKPWYELELFQLMRTWPEGLDSGTRHVILYRRSCDHCEEMFYFDLSDPTIARNVTAIEVPETKTKMTADGGWAMPETEVEHLQLPLGTDWILTTPLIVTVKDGVVTCAEEGDHAGCMGL